MCYQVHPKLSFVLVGGMDFQRQTAFKAFHAVLSKYGIVFLLVCILMLPGVVLSEEQQVQQLEKQLNNALDKINTLSQRVKKLESAAKPKPVNNNSSDQAKNLEELERTVYELSDLVGTRAAVNLFDAAGIDIGGFLHSTFTAVDGEADSASAFNRQMFELLMRADLNKEWTAFMAQAFVRQSGINFTDVEARRTPSFTMGSATPLVIAWANYQKSDAANVRVGRFITPQGIINIEHFPASLLDTEQPQFLRPFSGDTIFPNFVDGVMLHGRGYWGAKKENKLGYQLYAANYVANTNKLVTGARLSYAIGDSGVELGLNVSQGERATFFTDYTSKGVDVLIDKGRFLWKTEYFQTDEELSVDRKAYYTQPAIRLNSNWLVFYRYDFLDSGLALGGETGETTERMLGVNYLPYANVRLRFTVTQKEFDSAVGLSKAEAGIVQLSSTFSF